MAMEDDVGVAVGLSRRKRRELGLTVFGLARIAARLQKAGELDGLSSVQKSAAILAEFYNSSLESVTADVSIDWDAVLEFIERLIELILKLMPLFM